MFDKKRVLEIGIKNVCKKIGGESCVFSSKDALSKDSNCFEFGSITKLYTAVAIYSLISEGRIKLSDNIYTYVDGMIWGENTSIGELLRMQPQLPDYINNPKIFYKELYSQSSGEAEFYSRLNGIIDRCDTNEIKEYIVRCISNHYGIKGEEVGTGYSNTNYFLLGYIIERISGDNYFTYLYDKGIKSTGNGLDRDFGITWPSRFTYSSCGLRGTFSDLKKLYEDIIGNKWGYRKAIEEIETKSVRGPNYLYGVKRLGKWYYHDGRMPAVQSVFAFNMEGDICICAYGNKDKTISLTDMIFSLIHEYEAEERNESRRSTD